MSSKGGNAYTYGDSDHKHAATAMGSNSYTYDANGNMVARNIVTGSVTGMFNLEHNADNRLVEVTGPGSPPPTPTTATLPRSSPSWKAVGL